MALAITVSSPLIAAVTSSASAVPFVLLAAGLPCYLAQAVERGVLQGRLRFGDLAATLVIEAITRLGVAIALVLAGLGVSGATAGITASFVASWWLARRRVLALSARSGTEVEHDTAVSRSVTARRATQATMLLLVGQIMINNGDVVLAKTLFDADAAGVYSVVALIGRAIFFLSWSVVTAAFPMAAKADAVERRVAASTGSAHRCGDVGADDAGGRSSSHPRSPRSSSATHMPQRQVSSCRMRSRRRCSPLRTSWRR